MASLDKYTSIDIYRVIAFPLNNDGTFDLTEDGCGGGVIHLYEGIEFEAPTSFELNFGAVRQIPVVAQGQVQTTFMLPSIDPKTAVIRTAYDKLTLHALLSDTTVDTVGASKWLGMDTDKAGQEKMVGLHLSQLQTHDESGNSIWRNNVINRARISPNWPGYTDAAMIKEYSLSLSRSTKRLWGETYAETTHGHTEAVGDNGLSEYKLCIGVWMGNNVDTVFFLPADKPSRSAGTAKVWDFATGAARAGTWNTARTRFTPSVKPPDGIVLVATYEYV